MPPLHQGGPGTVAEEHTGAPVAKVHDTAEDFRPQYQAVLPGGGGQQALGGVQSVHKAGAGGVQIKAYGILRKAQLLLEQAGGGGGKKIRGDCGHQADADFAGGDAAPLQCLPGGGQTEGGVALAVGAVASGADAGAGGDPLVVGIHDFGQIIVGHDLFGHGGAGAD